MSFFAFVSKIRYDNKVNMLLGYKEAEVVLFLKNFVSSSIEERIRSGCENE
ncbi:hypothetical protein FH5_01424 [Priestia endophytica]|nr:hypothetical protein FH5_01424 [Priestia endophytica]